MPWFVDIVESERGWGQRIEDTERFPSKEKAENFVKQFNSQNDKQEVPDWYMYATTPYYEEKE